VDIIQATRECIEKLAAGSSNPATSAEAGQFLPLRLVDVDALCTVHSKGIPRNKTE
jgi:hypothetical protein